MAVNGIGGSTNNSWNVQVTTAANKSSTESSIEDVLDTAQEQQGKEDIIIKSDGRKSDPTKYYDPKTVGQMKNELSARYENMRMMVQNLILKQGQKAGGADVKIDININIDIKIGGGENADAAAEVADDGYWGADATANRILDFAKALTDDPAKLDLLIGAFKKGFEMAEKAFGGNLPDICYKTYDKVMEGFEKMKNPVTETTES